MKEKTVKSSKFRFLLLVTIMSFVWVGFGCGSNDKGTHLNKRSRTKALDRTKSGKLGRSTEKTEEKQQASFEKAAKIEKNVKWSIKNIDDEYVLKKVELLHNVRIGEKKNYSFSVTNTMPTSDDWSSTNMGKITGEYSKKLPTKAKEIFKGGLVLPYVIGQEGLDDGEEAEEEAEEEDNDVKLYEFYYFKHKPGTTDYREVRIFELGEDLEEMADGLGVVESKYDGETINFWEELESASFSDSGYVFDSSPEVTVKVGIPSKKKIKIVITVEEVELEEDDNEKERYIQKNFILTYEKS